MELWESGSNSLGKKGTRAQSLTFMGELSAVAGFPARGGAQFGPRFLLDDTSQGQKGAAGGPSGMMAEHLRVLFHNENDSKEREMMMTTPKITCLGGGSCFHVGKIGRSSWPRLG